MSFRLSKRAMCSPRRCWMRSESSMIRSGNWMLASMYPETESAMCSKPQASTKIWIIRQIVEHAKGSAVFEPFDQHTAAVQLGETMRAGQGRQALFARPDGSLHRKVRAPPRGYSHTRTGRRIPQNRGCAGCPNRCRAQPAARWFVHLPEPGRMPPANAGSRDAFSCPASAWHPIPSTAPTAGCWHRSERAGPGTPSDASGWTGRVEEYPFQAAGACLARSMFARSSIWVRRE